MRLDELQRQVDAWIRDNGGYWTAFQILSRLPEELGEIAAALQRTAGLRPRPTDPDLAGEVGDLLFTLAVFANVNQIDLDQALTKTLNKYDLRDSAAWKGKLP